MGLTLLLIGLVVFIGGHVFVSLRQPRAALISRIGEGFYKGLFSLVSAVGLGLIIYGFGRYRSDGLIPVWSPPTFLRGVTELLMWPAFVLVIAAYIPGTIKTALTHPMLAGVKLWAFAHLLANGDLGGIILFGSILAWAVYDRITLKRRADAGGPQIPVGGLTNDLLAVVVGTLIYLAVGFVFHPLAGVPVFGGKVAG
jgi:uncharacterized membrane protein